MDERHREAIISFIGSDSERCRADRTIVGAVAFPLYICRRGDWFNCFPSC